jgi:hypothetical protein
MPATASRWRNDHPNIRAAVHGAADLPRAEEMNKRGTMLDPEYDARYIVFTDAQLQALIDLYALGWSTRKLGKRYGISACTVRRRLVSLGVDLRGQGQNNVVTDQVLGVTRHMLARGAPWRAINWATGVAPDSIMNAMRRKRKRSAAE